MTAPIIVKYWTIPIESPSGEMGLIKPAEDELERAARYVTDVHSRRYLRARQAIRKVLSAETGIGAEDLHIVAGVDGRPELFSAHDRVHFNISHSGELILLGLCREAQIGVDLEVISPIEKNLVERFFSLAEQSALERIPEADWLRCFYRCWTRKEAFVKGMGKGLKLPLDKFDVSIGDVPQLLACQFADPSAWTMGSLSVAEHYEAVVAAETFGRPLRLEKRPSHEAEPTVA